MLNFYQNEMVVNAFREVNYFLAKLYIIKQKEQLDHKIIDINEFYNNLGKYEFITFSDVKTYLTRDEMLEIVNSLYSPSDLIKNTSEEIGNRK